MFKWFGECLCDFYFDYVCVVVINMLCVVKNVVEFFGEVEVVFGFLIEVIVGCEEVCFIYVGVVYLVLVSVGKWFVVDIGGGLIEFIIGLYYMLIVMESFYIGCVSYSCMFFLVGNVDEYMMW